MKSINLRRHFPLIGMLMVAAFLTMQCAGPVSAPATQAPAAQPTQPPAAAQATQPAGATQAAQPAGKTKIVYLSFFSEGEPIQIILDKATKEFMQENPDIEVETKWAGRQNLTQLQTALAAGTQVDITDQNTDSIYNALVKTNLALPLDKYLDEKAYDGSKAWKDTFVTGALDLGKGPDGHFYMIPRDDYIAAFFYNVKMLKELGFEPNPTDITWDEFLNILQAVKDKKPGVSPLGVDTSIGFLNNWYFTYLAVRLAGQEAFYAAANDKTGEKWGDPAFLKAAEMVRELSDKGYFQDGFTGSTWPSSQVLWVNGQTSMMFMGAWLPSEMSQQMPEGFQVGLFAFPNVEGGKGNGLVEHWANVYVILKDSKNPDAAAKYLKYISTPKIGAELSKVGTPSPVAGVPASIGLENQNTILEKFKTSSARFGLTQDLPEYTDKVFNACDDKLFKLQATPQQFIDCLKTESKAYWANK